ncbi:MAG TPA: head GIN domain-containing protein [Burkholderiaceae bacterium]|nr:head GIN domain-containing protein [Burkholderiaceae bacterium]HQR70665.1 head GIN domain-containing protein [Burkholderiaceae bacterium]
MKILLLLLGFCVSGAALAQPLVPIAGTVTVGTPGSRIDGSGRQADEVRTVGPFSAIRVNGPIDLVLKASEREQVTVRFDDNLLAFIETRIVGDAVPTLDIRVLPEAGFRSSRPPKVIVEFRSIEALSMRGSGDVVADSVRGKVLAVAIAGSSDVKFESMDVDVLGVSIGGSGNFAATGRAADQGYSIAGSGDVNAIDLVGQTVKVRIAGSGDARVHATQRLDASVAGSGDVIYRGDPVIRKSIAGSGEVRRAR